MAGSRRNLFIAGAVGIAAAGLAGQAAARTLTETEAANLELVKAFVFSLQERPYDAPAHLARFFTTDAKIKVADDAPTLAPAAAAAEIDQFTTVSRFKVTIDEAHVTGPFVVTFRTDTIITPGKADVVVPVIGVFVVRGGKITEWTDRLAA